MNKYVNGELVALTQEEITQREAEIAAHEAEELATGYINKRQSEYPAIAEQLDYIYHNGVAAWKKDIIKPVKDKYPKGVN
jgi:hypothetical protein